MDLVHRDRLERRGASMPTLVENRPAPTSACGRCPLQVSSGFCGLRYFGRALLATRCACTAGCELGEDVAHLVAVRGDAALKLGAKVLSALTLARRHLGLRLAYEVGELVDVEYRKCPMVVM